MQKKENLRSVLFWIVAMILCPLGVAFAIKGGFGVSMIEAPVLVLYRQLSQYFARYTVGTSEYVLQALVLLLLCVAIRRFRWRYLLSFVTAVIYGFILDGWNHILSGLPTELLAIRIVYTVIGTILTAIAVAFFFRTKMPQEVWELFVKELSERYHLNMTKVKWIYDLATLAVAAILMLIFFGRINFEVIGIGTVVTTLVNAPLIGLFGKIIDRTIGAKPLKDYGLHIELTDNEWPKPAEPLKDRRIVRAIVIDEEGFFYFVRAYRDDDFGKAELIETSGGGVEENEEFVAAIHRELGEELGAQVELLAKIGEVSDAYHLIGRHNINHYYLAKITGWGQKHLTEDEINEFHLSTLRLSKEEALAEYERCCITPVGRLIAAREVPILKAAFRILAGEDPLAENIIEATSAADEIPMRP